MAKVTYLVNVKGIVQGVGFRFFTANQAKMTGVTGYAKNLSDGSVDVMISGEEEPVRMLIQWLKDGGPRSATVESIKQRELPWKYFQDFSIRY